MADLPLKRLMDARRFRDAFEYYHGAEASDDRDDPDQQLLAAEASSRLGELALGHQLATAAYEQFVSGEDDVGVMQVSNLLGAIAFERGRVSHARVHYARSLELARRHGRWAMVARTTNNLATLSHLRGASDAAIPLFCEAANLFHATKDPRGGAEADHNLGLLFHQLGRLDEAYQSATSAVQQAERSHDRSLQALTVLGLAEIAIDRGDLVLGQQKIVRGAVLAGEAGDQLNGIEAGRLRALLTYRRGDFALAHHLAEVAGSIAGNLGSALLRAECSALSALALVAEGRVGDAERKREEVVGAFEGFGASHKVHRFAEEWRSAVAGVPRRSLRPRPGSQGGPSPQGSPVHDSDG